MMVAIGVGAWDAAMFHLVTHAFFKCLLFLGAGAVIHEMAHLKHAHQLDFDPQDINNMGGLRKQMPKTFILMAIASLALAGFPLTSGFFSKDAILISSYEWAISKGGASILIPVLLTIVSVLTAFYIGRLIFKVFFGEFKLSVSNSNIHDANRTMLLPMAFLGICSLFFVFSLNPISYHDANVFQGFYVDYNFEEIHSLHVLIPIGLTLASCFMWIIAWRWYVKGAYPLNGASKGIAFSLNQGYLNQFYARTFVAGTVNLSKGLYWFDRNIIDGIVNQLGTLAKAISRVAAWVDKYIVDGFINTLGGTTYYFGHLLRWVQNGRLQNYLGFAFTVLLIGIIYLILT